MISIEAGMCDEAVRIGKRIGILGTVGTSMKVVEDRMKSLQENQHIDGEVIAQLIEVRTTTTKEDLDKRMLEESIKIANQVDVILFAQGSMAHAAEGISNRIGKPVLGSVASAAKQLKEVMNTYDA